MGRIKKLETIPTEKEIENFKKWLSSQGVQVLNDEYGRSVSFIGLNKGTLYSDGSYNNSYFKRAWNAFKEGKGWVDKPLSVSNKKITKARRPYIIQALRERDGNNCFYCGEPLEGDITIDHLNPLIRGGGHDLHNLALMHRECNNKLDNMPLPKKIKKIINKQLEKHITNG